MTLDKLKNLTKKINLNGCLTEWPALGLDISDTSLKLVQMKKNKNGGAEITNFQELSMEKGIIANGEIKNTTKLSENITKIIAMAIKNSGKIGCDVISALPENNTFVKLLKIPKGSSEENKFELIKKEIINYIPFSPEALYMDWQSVDSINKDPHNYDAEKDYVLVGAAPQQIVDSYTQVLEIAGTNPIAMEIEAVAIVRAIITENQNKQQDVAKIIVDFGANRTGLIVYDHETIQFSVSLPISGKQITNILAQKLKVSEEEAEKTKVECGFDKKKCKGAIQNTLYETLDELILRINNAVDFYDSRFPHPSPVGEIILCGGGANLPNIDQALEEKLKVHITLANPLTNLIFSKKLPAMNAERGRQFCTAIGLALRGLQNNVNL